MTAELEISKGHLTRVVGFIEVGEVVQAKAIGETEGSMRQRVLDERPWWVKAVRGEGWVSIWSVSGRRLLEPVLA